MDDVDAVRPRRRPKDSFQNELQSKLKQRRSLGLSAEVTDSDEDVIASPRMDFMKSRAARPSSAKRRPDQSPNLSQGLGTTTMRTRDLSSLLGRRDDDEEDEEIIAANLGRSGSSGRLPSPGMKSPSPKMDPSYMRRTPTLGGSPKEQTGKLDSLYANRKTPTKDMSPRTPPLSKEEIIFGRKTPVEDRKSPSDGSKNRLPGMDDRPWQPPNFRSASPGLSDHSRGSRGVTPTDATLDTISETPREKYGSRGQLGQKTDTSPRQLALMGDRPKPQARSRVGDSKTPPLVDPRRKSPSSPSETQSNLKRTTPTLDLFGSHREQAAQEVQGYLEKDVKKSLYGSKSMDGRKTLDGKQAYGRDKTPEKGRASPGAGKASPRMGRTSPGARFAQDSRKTPTDKRNETDRKTPLGRKTPTDFQRKSPLDKTPSQEEIEERQRKARSGSTLLDFLTEDAGTGEKPKAQPRPQERKKKAPQSTDDVLDDLLMANRKALGMGNRSGSPEGRKSPTPKERRMPVKPKSATTSFEDQRPPMDLKQQNPEDTSSLCEEIPPDPNRKVAKEAEKDIRSGKQRSDRALTDNVINMVTDAQTMQYIQPAKKIRPVTAEAKVQHRPKPRYGMLPGEEKSIQEREFNSTTDIRDAIYEEWYKARMEVDRKKKQEEKLKQMKKDEEEKKKKEDKRQESEASYNAWLKEKKHKLSEDRKQQLIKEEKEKEEQRKKEEDKDTGSYEAWKKKKLACIKEEKRKKEEEDRIKKEEEEYKKKQDAEEKRRAHSAWVKKKEKLWQNQTMKKKEEIKTKREKEQELQEELKKKERDASDKYYEWIERKEQHKKKEKRLNKQRTMMEEDDPKPAWYPSNRTIPFGR